MAHLGQHAVVIGASMGGLLAARALADHYEAVTVIERDRLPDGRAPRKGVPQGAHAHGLLARGRAALEELFPGLGEELVAQGAVYGDVVDNVLWFNHGVYLRNAPSGLQGLLLSRPLLEDGVRRRLLQLPNIRLQQEIAVLEPVYDRDAGRVAGVRVAAVGGTAEADTIAADLVVDGGGRGSRSPAWLEALGYERPREASVEVEIGYMTGHFRRKPEHLPGKQAVVMAACAPDWRVGVILAQEADRWIVTLGGYFGDYAPADPTGYIDFARSLQKPEIFEVIRDAELLSPLMPYRFTANLRRHYEELSRFPEGHVVFGDALCSFNPVYGQGMTVAATEALALRQCLAAGAQGIARRFFQAAKPLIDIPWQIAVGSDLQHPQVPGERTRQVRFINWYLGKLYQAGERDPILAERFLQVANLMQQPAALMHPGSALRVWKGRRRAS